MCNAGRVGRGAGRSDLPGVQKHRPALQEPHPVAVFQPERREEPDAADQLPCGRHLSESARCHDGRRDGKRRDQEPAGEVQKGGDQRRPAGHRARYEDRLAQVRQV